MANDIQVKSAIGTYNTILNLIKKSSLQKRNYVPPPQPQPVIILSFKFQQRKFKFKI